MAPRSSTTYGKNILAIGITTIEGNGNVFTGKYRFYLQHNDVRIRVWRHHGERMLNYFVMHHQTFPAQGIMVWISRPHPSGTLCWYTEQPALHIRSLKPVVIQCVQHLPSAIFQQDIELPHVAHNIKQFFFTHQFELFLWPACSPDLSPIENVRSIFSQRLAWDAPPTATADQLWQYVQVAWTAVPQAYIQSLLYSMTSDGSKCESAITDLQPEAPEKSEDTARFQPTGHDFLEVYLDWLGLVADAAYSLCGNARVDADHLL
ncbi:transposable element Tcb1 transposase [Trichonephila clavipes]|nr:transposable element Tcb1 transposase [Trichonephila clavipes]